MSLPLFHFYKHNITLNSKRKKKYPSLSLQNPPSIHQSKYLGSDSAENLTGTALIISSCSVYCFLFFHPQIQELNDMFFLCVHLLVSFWLLFWLIRATWSQLTRSTPEHRFFFIWSEVRILNKCFFVLPYFLLKIAIKMLKDRSFG